MLTMRQKKAVTREWRDRYQRSSKKEKTMKLNEFIQLTGYNRCYAGQVLKVKKEKVLGQLNIGGKRIKYIEDKRKIQREKKIYDQDLLVALKEIGKISDYMRLPPFLSEIIPVSEKHGEINLTTKIRAATIDRLLADTRKRYRIIGRSTTRNLTKEEYPH